MCRVITYNEIDREAWGRLVRESATGTWFQTPEAFDFFNEQKDLFKPFVFAIVASSQPSPEGKGETPTHKQPYDSFASVWGVHTADSTQYDLLKAHAQANRNNPTEAESILWDMLKSNNIGLHFRRQHIILDYIVDFICIEKGLVIELDGGYHTNPEQEEYDKQRTAHLQNLGYTELRFTNEELLVKPEEVMAKIKAVAYNLPSFQGRTEDRLTLRAICVGYVTKEKSAVKQFFTRRAIIMGGPVFSDNITDEEVYELMRAVREMPILNPSLKGRTTNHSSLQGRAGKRLLSPIYIETRNFNDYSRWKEAFEKAGFAYKKHLNFHVDCTDKEAMWERLSENRKRQIRKQPTSSSSLKGREITNGGVTEEEIREWYDILAKLYRTKVRTPLWPVEFFLEAYRQGVGKFLLVKHNNHVIGGSMIVVKGLPVTGDGLRDDRGCVYEWFECGLNAKYKEQYPSVMATWAGMQYAAEHGCTRYDMMGAGEPGVPYGVRDFKSEFGGEQVEHGRFLCVTQPILYKLGVMAVRLLKHSK